MYFSQLCTTRIQPRSTRARNTRTRKNRLHLECLEDRSLPSTFTVLNLADSGAGSLRQMILDAESNPGPDVIIFAKSVRGTITLTGGQLNIASDLTIDGPGANALTISGNNSSRIFNVIGGADTSGAIAVTISGLTISDGRAVVGGGVENKGFSELTLARVAVSHNQAFSGGGLDNFGDGASLILTDSVVTGNTALFAFPANGGGIFNRFSKSLTVTHCTVSGNEAISTGAGFVGLGGGISSRGNTSTSITDTIISNNLAMGGDGSLSVGGGVSIIFGAADFANCSFTGNQVVGGAHGGLGQGGGLFVELTDQVAVGNCAFTDNQAVGGTHGGNARGGGLCALVFTQVEINNSTLVHNRAFGANLGGLAEGGAIVADGPVSVSNSRLTDNHAIAGNGGTHSGSDLSVATAFGGAISSDSFLEVSNCILRGNQAIGGNNAVVSDAPNEAEAGGADGGAIFNTFGGQAVIRDSVIEHNQAIGGNGNTAIGHTAFAGAAVGGGINNQFDGAFFGIGPTRVTVIDSSITDNDAVGGNGNSATGSAPFAGAGLGGGIANYFGCATDIDAVLIAHNRAIGGVHNESFGGPVLAGLGAGGGIFNAFGNFVLDTGDALAPSIVNVSNSTLEQNQAHGGEGDTRGGDGWGGAIAALFAATTNVTDCTLEMNHALGGDADDGGRGGNAYGGGAYNDATSALALKSTTVTKNQADGGDASAGGGDGEGIGGGIYNLGSLAFDAGTVITKNHASTSNDDIFT
jgi:hypothetical protein